MTSFATRVFAPPEFLIFATPGLCGEASKHRRQGSADTLKQGRADKAHATL